MQGNDTGSPTVTLAVYRAVGFDITVSDRPGSAVADSVRFVLPALSGGLPEPSLVRGTIPVGEGATIGSVREVSIWESKR